MFCADRREEQREAHVGAPRRTHLAEPQQASSRRGRR
mgnify:CR=1 FL=1